MNLIKHLSPVITTFENRLSLWKASTLSIGGRITLIRSVLDSLPSHFFSLYKASVSVISKLESIIKSFFWGGSLSNRKIHWVSWDRIIAPVDTGGLGLGCLHFKNLSLLSKWWWRLKKEPNSLWARVINAIHLSSRNCSLVPVKNGLVGVLNSIAKLNSHLNVFDVSLEDCFTGTVGNGSSIRFWIDKWSGLKPLSASFPELFHLESHKGCLIKDRCIGNGHFSNWEWNWTRPPSSPLELHQLQELLTQISSFSLTDLPDRWSWNHDSSGVYSVKSMRNLLQSAYHGPNRWVFPWNSIAPSKVNILGWRIEMDRLATSDQLLQRNIPIASPNCPLCNNHNESSTHLFLHCSFVDIIWCAICSWCRLPPSKPFSTHDLFNWHKNDWTTPRTGRYVNLIILAFCWIIWKARNECIFSRKSPSIRYAIKDIKVTSFLWLQNRDRRSQITWNQWNSFYL